MRRLKRFSRPTAVDVVALGVVLLLGMVLAMVDGALTLGLGFLMDHLHTWMGR